MCFCLCGRLPKKYNVCPYVYIFMYMCCSVLHCGLVTCSDLQCAAVCCSVLQRAIVCYSLYCNLLCSVLLRAGVW